MKKSFIVFTLLLTFCFMIFSQENSEQKISDKNTAPIEFSVLAPNILKLTPDFTIFLKNAEMKTMFHSVASNEKTKRQNSRQSLLSDFFEPLIGNIVTDSINTYRETPPKKKDALKDAALMIGGISYFGILIASEIEKAKYLQNSDNADKLISQNY